jgi:SpoVK/Ycf46/Vps4 family AAA+-type ATPase
LGILKTDKFIEIKRDDLVGEYLGQTSIKTRQLLESAMGGVLFLDEAYSLGNKEKRDSFSKEAIDMLNQYLSERKGEFMFIIAGYEDDMNSCLFGYNKGLRRRFHSHYKINGYQPIELKEIFVRKVNLTPFKLNISDDELNKFFTDNKSQFSYFGGDVEKFINEIKQCQSLRAFNANLQDKIIILEDMKMAITNLEEKNEESPPPINMYL